MNQKTTQETSTRTPSPDLSSEQLCTLERIGPYRILEELGTGGMGTVYLAEQIEPIQRTVALKLVRTGITDPEITSRFEAERQALARMSHPNIAQAFDAGTAEDEQPYFVMEYVAGLPITEYCDGKHLSVRERLELFIATCEGVQHAHQKGVVHRDIKPSNVLITEIQECPTPKVIDFGIAKAIDQPLTKKTLLTGNRLLGTPAYLSPETIQASMGGVDIDTRTDVYSLGILLYELLIGVLPFDSDNATFLQILRNITEGEAPSLSQRLTTLDLDQQMRCAEFRGTRLRKLYLQLRGDLEWISGKAIAKDRRRRYSSVAELSTDIRRHLNHQPIAAGAPSTFYRLKKFARRNQTATASALLTALALITGLTGRTLEAQRANREAQRANHETQRANREAETAQQVSAFLIDLFELADPSEARGNTITAREILDRGAERIRDKLTDRPLTQARLIDVIGSVYLKLGLFAPAVELYSEALVIRQNQLVDDHLDIATSFFHLAHVYRKQGHYEEARQMYERALKIQEGILGPENVGVAETLDGLATIYLRQGSFSEARILYERSLDIRKKALGENHLDLSMSLSGLGGIHWYQGQYEEAEPYYKRALAIREEALDSEHPQVARSLNNLALLYSSQEKYIEAEPLYRRSLAIQEKVHGPNHPEVGHDLVNIGDLLIAQGRYQEAEAALNRALAIFEEVFPPNSIEGSHALFGLATVYENQKRYEDAEDMYKRAIYIRQKILASDHPDLMKAINAYAKLLTSVGRSEEATSLRNRLFPRHSKP